MKKKLQEILHDSDLLHASVDAVLLYGALQVVNVISSTAFKVDLNAFRTFDHVAIGVLTGAFFYRKMGGGLRGFACGVGVATGYNVLWESMEPSIPNYNGESLLDTASDIAAVYGGVIVSSGFERFKSWLNESNQSEARK